jgi:hypothetical protein
MRTMHADTCKCEALAWLLLEKLFVKLSEAIPGRVLASCGASDVQMSVQILLPYLQMPLCARCAARYFTCTLCSQSMSVFLSASSNFCRRS